MNCNIESVWGDSLYTICSTSTQILGIDSEFCIVESFITGMVDYWPDRLRPHRVKFTIAICLIMFALGIPMVTNVSIVHNENIMNPLRYQTCREIDREK